MSLQVVGAGVGRTGTHSLKLALEELLGGPCYHMLEVFDHGEHVPLWEAAVEGDLQDWDAIFGKYNATVDWPSASFWPELSVAYPDALILLSVRDADDWWRSATNTIFQTLTNPPPAEDAERWLNLVKRLLATRFTANIEDADAAKAAYVRHNDDVRTRVPSDRLLEWQPGDGWEPLCDRLGVAVPDAPFPHVNTTNDFREMIGLPALS
ncbi:MAG: hypothetical protein JWL83_336 [Actinomycetia bacterium]|nr:hypothetical protein [Actinomycetes bacterium]